MTAPLGVYGGYRPESSESRALGSFNADKFAYQDQQKNLIQLNNAVGYISGYMRKMQKGIDDANQNFIQQLQGLVSEFFVLLAGGGDTGLDIGDLKYILQAIGALFGFNNGVLPINLFSAAWHFVSTYIFPTDNFHDLMDLIIDGAIASVLDIFGEVPIVGQALQQLAQIISSIRDALGPLLTAVDALFAAFGGDLDTGDLGSFGGLWETLLTLFGTITAPVAAALAPLWPVLSQITQPFIDTLTQIIEFVTNFIDVITGGVNTIDDFIGGAFNPISILVNIVSALISGGLGGAGSMDWGGLVSGLFGIGGGDQSLFNQLGTNLQKFLGNTNFLSSGFNLGTALQDFLHGSLAPAGALTTATQLPPNLFGSLRPGGVAQNQFPDPSFDNPEVLDGLGLWNWSSVGRNKAGSAHTTAAGVIRQLIGVPVPTKVGDVTLMSGWLKWTGVNVTAGQQFLLKAISYDVDDVVINQATLASVTVPGAASASYVGNVGGWVQLGAEHQAPAGTSYVRFCLEISNTVIAGDIYLDDCVHQLTTGVVDASILANIENIPMLLGNSVGGFQGIADLIQTLGHYTDGLGSAFTQGGGLTGISLPTLFDLATAQTNNAITANFQAALHTLILGNRTNKSQGTGANATSQSSLEAAHFSSGGSLTTTSLVAGNTIGQIYTVPEFATYGFVEIMASGTSVTNIYLNIYKIGTANDTRTLLFTSANIASLITGSINHIRVLLPGMPMVNASDRLFIEICNNGSNALNVVTKATGIPNNTNEFIQNTGAARSILNYGLSPATILPGQSPYTGTVPYAVIGIANVPANYQPPESTAFLPAGSNTWYPPVWQANGDKIDLVGVGAGGGGGSANFYIQGTGGRKGTWNATQLVTGVHIPVGNPIYIITGAHGNNASVGNGTAGQATTFYWYDMSANLASLTCNGGAGGPLGGSSPTGQSPGNYTFNLIPYYGGAAVGVGQNGNAPGGGGAGAQIYSDGKDGGNGGAWVRVAQP